MLYVIRGLTPPARRVRERSLADGLARSWSGLDLLVARLEVEGADAVQGDVGQALDARRQLLHFLVDLAGRALAGHGAQPAGAFLVVLDGHAQPAAVQRGGGHAHRRRLAAPGLAAVRRLGDL